ncbi:MAG TPA: hypothetical protein VJ305_06810 [Streptosporangiaceae bacterium]|jgi:hypothetical protein|nr:hypothetical protein [Streptosporangiaceae bacterium]
MRSAARSSPSPPKAAEHIKALAQRYLGAPYPWYGGRDQVRVILAIRADKIRAMG